MQAEGIGAAVRLYGRVVCGKGTGMGREGRGGGSISSGRGASGPREGDEEHVAANTRRALCMRKKCSMHGGVQGHAFYPEMMLL